MILTLMAPEGSSEDDFDPFPGSVLAKSQGCNCPTDQNFPELYVRTDCPIHEPYDPNASH